MSTGNGILVWFFSQITKESIMSKAATAKKKEHSHRKETEKQQRQQLQQQ